MVRQAAVMLLGLMLFFGSIGSVFADAPLTENINDLLGIKYKNGGTTEKGFDCSGFTGYVFDQLGVELPRSSKSQAQIGTKVAKKDLREGDLVFFNTNGKNISHVGIFIGNGKMAHSSSSRGTIISKINDSYFGKRYVTARRILSETQYKDLATEIEKSAEVITETIESESSDVETDLSNEVDPHVEETSDVDVDADLITEQE